MHEFSVTRSLVEQVLTVAQQHGVQRVRVVRVRLGELSGIVPASVEFYFRELAKGTPAAEARLDFESVATRIRCPKCGGVFSQIDDVCSCNAGAEIDEGFGIVLTSIDAD